MLKIKPIRLILQKESKVIRGITNAQQGQKRHINNAFAPAGRMNLIGHNTTGRCPGLCAFGLSGRYQINIESQIFGILKISLTSASEKIPSICAICVHKRLYDFAFSFEHGTHGTNEKIRSFRVFRVQN